MPAKNLSPDMSSEIYDDDDVWPDAATAHLLMQRVLEHFRKHHVVVAKKLGHARRATIQSLQDMDAVYKDLRISKDSKEFREIKKYDQIWDEIIKAFANSGVTEEELAQIEHILTTIPDTIKRYYEALVMQDKILQDMIRELNSETYMKAIEATRKIQARLNPMSGLPPSIYDIDIENVSSKAANQQEVIVYTNIFKDRTR